MPDRERPMAGKTCLVTGATSGIGRETALALARLGASVVVVGRDPAKCASTVEMIKGATGNDSVESLVADLTSQAEVRRLAREVLERHDRLDVLVNNAGAMYDLRRESVDGIELTLALNHIAYFLLTNLLLDLLKASAPARIVNVASEAHRDVKGFDFDDPQALHLGRSLSAYGRSRVSGSLFALLLPPKHPAFLRYSETKLANLLFTGELANRLEGTGVTVNALHPGFVATDFTKGNGLLGWFLRRWASLLAISPADGARTSVYLATSPEVEGVTGGYFARSHPLPPSPAALDPEAAVRLWSLSEEWAGRESRRQS